MHDDLFKNLSGDPLSIFKETTLERAAFYAS